MTWEQDVLRYNPYADDKDDGGVWVLSDKIVTARVGGLCWHCGQDVVPGTRVRVETAVVDSSVKSCRTCHDCCDAMARSWADDGAAIGRRAALRVAEGGEG